MSHYNTETIISELQAIADERFKGKAVLANAAIIDGPVQVSVRISKRAAQRAVADDCTRCTIAQQCVIDGYAAIILPTVAYLWSPKRPGAILKLVPDTVSKATIRNLDEKGADLYGHTVTLKPPPASRKVRARAGTAARRGSPGRRWTEAEKAERAESFRSKRRIGASA